jgi:hypothetical protein
LALSTCFADLVLACSRQKVIISALVRRERFCLVMGLAWEFPDRTWGLGGGLICDSSASGPNTYDLEMYQTYRFVRLRGLGGYWWYHSGKMMLMLLTGFFWGGGSVWGFLRFQRVILMRFKMPTQDDVCCWSCEPSKIYG